MMSADLFAGQWLNRAIANRIQLRGQPRIQRISCQTLFHIGSPIGEPLLHPSINYRIKSVITNTAILIMKLLLNNTPIDVGMKFGVRGGAQVRTGGKVRVRTRWAGDSSEQLLLVLKEDEIVDDVKRDEESVAP